MIDGSLLPYEENVALTKQAVEIAHAASVSKAHQTGAANGYSERNQPIGRYFSRPSRRLCQLGSGVIRFRSAGHLQNQYIQRYKHAYFKKAREILSTTELWDPNAIYPECIAEARNVIRYKMELFHSEKLANLIIA